jgi:DNA-binding SARP family transcriptional activator
MARLYLTVLGGFELRADSRTIAVPSKKAQALLAYLALRPGRAHARETLVGLLWGDASEARARHSLRQVIFRLRQAFARARNASLVVRGDTVTLDTAAISVDALEFQRLLGLGTVRALETALTLYRGALLEGVHLDEAPFDEWLQPERELLRGAALGALGRVLDHQMKRGSVEAALQTARRLLALDPLQEGTHRALMRLYVLQGRRGDALRQYQACVGLLRRELDVDPEPETRRLYQEILQKRALTASGPAADPSSAPRREAPRPARDVRALEPAVVGRQAELARLRQALEDAGGGSGRAVIVLGEAGIGKTRLLEELAAATTQRGGRLIVSRCYETEQILPFGPWVEALRTALDEPGRAALDGLDPLSRAELVRLLPELAEPGRKPPGPADDHLRLFGAVARVIEALAATGPVVLVLEDLHWADEMSVRLLGFVARRIERQPCLLIATARTEELGETPLIRRLLEELRQQRHAATLTLVALSKAETRRLVEILTGAETRTGALDRIAEQVWTLSEGNPFVAVETMRALHEGHRFDPLPIRLPGRVREAIGGRLERLSPRARDLLAVAAVIGREFDFALLQRAAGLDGQDAAEGVEELVRRSVLHGVGPRLDFTHARIRDVAYDRILESRRAQLHAAVGAAMEAVHAGALRSHHGAMGMHYRRGEVWDKAFHFLRQAGVGAVDCSANREALAYFEQAREVLEHLPEGRSRTEQACDLEMYRAAVLYSMGELRQIVARLGDIEALARALHDPLRGGRIDLLRLGCCVAMGDQPAALAAGAQVLAVAAETDNLPLHASGAYLLGVVHAALGDYVKSTTYLGTCAAVLRDQPARRRLGQIAPPAVLWRGWKIVPLSELGEFGEALALGERALEIATTPEQPYGLMLTHGALGHLHVVRGAPAVGIPVLERAVALCRDHEIAVLAPWIVASLGHVYALSGRLGEALSLLEEAVASGEAGCVLWWQSRRLAQLGEAYLAAGRPAEGRAAIEHALALADAHGERGNRAHGLRALAEAALQSKDVVRAGCALREALDLAETLSMRPLAARCRLDLGRLHLRIGERLTAHDLLTTAATRLRALEMPLWAEQAEAELALLV